MTPGKFLEWTMPLIPVDGPSTVMLRVVYANAAGAAISTRTQATSVDNIKLVSRSFKNPANAASATVTIGSLGSDGDSEVVVSEAGFSGMMGMGGCTWPGREIENPGGGCPDCPDCDISCDEGDPVQTCIIDSDTCEIITNDCDCPEGGEEFMSSASWN